ncbi:MAG: helix-turn-helix domain-containing protein [Oscillospiraceae bacterium]|nr:helix-turn-helix domain-containing protein [Oscillospiraceae bacterium]
MTEVTIGKIIIGKRKEKGVTQDELAHFIGVSKSSVSKWETGQSLPDIAHLPQLASYFGASLDELMGYDPQMTKEDINKLYEELSTEFAAKPFDEVMNRCRDIIKKYFSCFPLLYRMGLLFVNYGMTMEDDALEKAAITEARELFIRVKKQSGDAELKQLALRLEATCELALGRPNEAIELLQDISCQPPHEGLLAQAYMMIGKEAEAKTLFQKKIYYNLHMLMGTIPQYLVFFADDCRQVEELCKRATGLISAFHLKTLDPTGILPFYIAAAQAYMANGKKAEALDLLEAYTDLVLGLTYPLDFLKGDAFFDSIKKLEDELPFGQAEMPRDETSIRQSMADEVIENPVFSALFDEPRFKRLCGGLRGNLR